MEENNKNFIELSNLNTFYEITTNSISNSERYLG